MGEYATYQGADIKIGTCESMYYLRADQIDLVRTNALSDLTAVRFRFPFPDEDHIKPGDFNPYNRGFPVRGIEPPSVDGLHHRIQFGDNNDAGILIMLPCPYSPEGKASDLKYMYNGYRGPARVVQQRAWDGVWATVMDCGACGALWRLSALDDALPVIEALIAEGDRYNASPMKDGERYHEVAARIRQGYDTPVTKD